MRTEAKRKVASDDREWPALELSGWGPLRIAAPLRRASELASRVFVAPDHARDANGPFDERREVA